MPYRSPARWLAPLSLVASLVAVIAILGGGSEDEAPDRPAATRPASSRSAGQVTSAQTPTRRQGSTYTVKSGDVLSAIAQRTGVTVARLQELNPDIDAQTLRVGQRLKLRE